MLVLMVNATKIISLSRPWVNPGYLHRAYRAGVWKYEPDCVERACTNSRSATSNGKQEENQKHGRPAPRSSLRLPHPAALAGIYRSRSAHAGARDRGQYGDLQRGSRDHPEAAAVSRSVEARDRLGYLPAAVSENRCFSRGDRSLETAG